jgi:hypothetical protein
MTIPKRTVSDQPEPAPKVQDALEAGAVPKGTVSTKDVMEALKDLARAQVALVQEIQDLRKELGAK